MTTEAVAFPALSAYLKLDPEGFHPPPPPSSSPGAMGETQRRQNGVQLRQQLQSVFVAGLEGSEAICSKGPPGEKTRKLSV